MAAIHQILFSSYSNQITNNAVKFKAYSNATYSTNSLSIGGNTPSNLKKDDCILAFILCRSELVNNPDYTIIGSVTCTGGGIVQKLYVAKRNVSLDGENGIFDVFQQTEIIGTGRMGLSFLLLTGKKNGYTISDVKNTFVNNIDSYTITPEILTATINSIIVSTASTIVQYNDIATIAKPQTDFTNPGQALNGNRLMSSYKEVTEDTYTTYSNINFFEGSSIGSPDNGMNNIIFKVS